MKSFMSFVQNLLLILVAAFAGGTLVVIANGVSTGTELTPFNSAIEALMIHIRMPVLTGIMLFVTNVGSPFVLGSLAFLIAAYLLLKKDMYDAFLYMASMVISTISFVVLKNAFHISRPLGGIVALVSWSFPSGHATVAAAFFFSTGYVFFGRMKSVVGKIALVVGCIGAPALISFSRIYLGVHFALDVLAGTALGILCVSIVILFFNIFLEEEKWRHKRLFARIERLTR